MIFYFLAVIWLLKYVGVTSYLRLKSRPNTVRFENPDAVATSLMLIFGLSVISWQAYSRRKSRMKSGNPSQQEKAAPIRRSLMWKPIHQHLTTEV